MAAMDLTDVTWRKSSFSYNNGSCVEIAAVPDGRVAVRDSKHPQAGVVLFTRGEVAAFLDGVKAREFDDLG